MLEDCHCQRGHLQISSSSPKQRRKQAEAAVFWGEIYYLALSEGYLNILY